MHEMFTYYTGPSPQRDVLYSWANDHKTMIVLNGGDSLSLSELYNELLPVATSLNLPTSMFYEDERSLNSALTCVGVIVPSSVYELDLTNPQELVNSTAVEATLKEIISRCGLAR